MEPCAFDKQDILSGYFTHFSITQRISNEFGICKVKPRVFALFGGAQLDDKNKTSVSCNTNKRDLIIIVAGWEDNFYERFKELTEQGYHFLYGFCNLGDTKLLLNDIYDNCSSLLFDSVYWKRGKSYIYCLESKDIKIFKNVKINKSLLVMDFWDVGRILYETIYNSCKQFKYSFKESVLQNSLILLKNPSVIKAINNININDECNTFTKIFYPTKDFKEKSYGYQQQAHNNNGTKNNDIPYEEDKIFFSKQDEKKQMFSNITQDKSILRAIDTSTLVGIKKNLETNEEITENFEDDDTNNQNSKVSIYFGDWCGTDDEETNLTSKKIDIDDKK